MSDLIESLGRRLTTFTNSLDEKAKSLNAKRNDLRKTKQGVIGDKKYHTNKNAIASDIVFFNNRIIVGLNVDYKNIDLDINDILPNYDMDCVSISDNILNNDEFVKTIKNLMSYSDDIKLFKVTVEDNNLYVSFSTHKSRLSLKTYQWVLSGGEVVYSGEYLGKVLNVENKLSWNQIPADVFNTGNFPNKSILDKVYLSIGSRELSFSRVNDTTVNRAFFKEDLESNQVLSDSRVFYIDYNDFIAIRVDLTSGVSRFYLYNTLSGSVYRADGIEKSLSVIDGGDGCVFSNGYLLVKSDDFKVFNISTDYIFQKTIESPNGEDILYVFFNNNSQSYIIYPYNVVEKEIHQYINAGGFTILDNGTLFISGEQKTPSKLHNVQVLSTNFYSNEFFYKMENERVGEGLFAEVNNNSIVNYLSSVFNIVNISRIDDKNTDRFLNIVKLISECKHTNGWSNNYEDSKSINEELDTINTIALSFMQEIEQFEIKKIEDQTRVVDAANSVKRISIINNPELVNSINEIAEIISAIDGEINSISQLESTIDDNTLLEEVGGLKEQLFSLKNNAGKKLIKIVADEESFDDFNNTISDIEESFKQADSLFLVGKIKDELSELANAVGLVNDELSTLDIEDISDFESIQNSLTSVYSKINTIKGDVEGKYNDIFVSENGARFSSSIELLNQYISNELSRVDDLKTLEDSSIKINTRIDSLDSQFSVFEEYSTQLLNIRDSLEETILNKREVIISENNKLLIQLEKGFDLNFNAIKGRINKLESVDKLNEFFASDTYVNRAIESANKITKMGETVKGDSLISKITSLKDSSFRDVRDKQDLYTDGGTFLKLGRNKFPVNREEFKINIINKGGDLFAALRSTNYERKLTGDITNYRDVYDMTVNSETENISRSEFLAYEFINSLDFNYDEILKIVESDKLIDAIRIVASKNIGGGYSVGIHDVDAQKIVETVVDSLASVGGDSKRSENIIKIIELLVKPSVQNSKLMVFDNFIDEKSLNLASVINDFCKKVGDYDTLVEFIGVRSSRLRGYEEAMSLFIDSLNGINNVVEITNESNAIAELVIDYIGKDMNIFNLYESYANNIDMAYLNLRKSFNMAFNKLKINADISEVYLAFLIKVIEVEKIAGVSFKFEKIDFNENFEISGLRTKHGRIVNGVLNINIRDFIAESKHLKNSVQLRFDLLRDEKRKYIAHYEELLGVDSFVAKPISAFIRNRLITNSYLDIIGNNLAKQIGSSGSGGAIDNMGLLMLISPPGYGKTTLVEYIASKIGMVFVKINCPSIGNDVKSLDPSESKDLTSRREIEKINNAFEMGDNVMLYLDDIQHTNPELLQKFISLCDATRTIDGVIDGKQKTFDLKGRKFAIVMSGNPYTESGDLFKVPDMLANRADVYNLGDMLSDQEDDFNMSYIENSLTANNLTRPLAFRDLNDLYEMVDYILERKPNLSGVKHKYGQAELNDIVGMVRNMIKIQRTILKVNENYIHSSTISDEFRVEPAFKMQGSYRNMNKMVSKLFVGITDKELDELIVDHYNGESQTLTNEAEINILRFKEITGRLYNGDADRLGEIRRNFTDSRKNKNEELLMIVEAIKSLSKF